MKQARTLKNWTTPLFLVILFVAQACTESTNLTTVPKPAPAPSAPGVGASEPISSISASPASIDITELDSYSLNTISFTGRSSSSSSPIPLSDFVISSSNASILSLTSNSSVSALAEGQAELRLVERRSSLTVRIPVTVRRRAVASLVSAPASLNLAVGASSNLTITLRDAQNRNLLTTGRVISWTNSSAATASLSATSGASVTVRALAAGAANLVATSEGRSVTVAVVVAAAAPAPAPMNPPAPTPTNPPAPTPINPNPNGLIFKSNFSTITPPWTERDFGMGNTGEATPTQQANRQRRTEILSDGGVWNNFPCSYFGGFYRLMEVVPGASKGWNAAGNLLRIRQLTSNDCGQVENTNRVPIGRDFYVRFYVLVERGVNYAFHPTTLNCCGAIQAVLWNKNSSANQNGYSMYFGLGDVPQPNGSPAGYSAQLTWNGVARFNEWYRVEHHVHFVDATHVQIFPQVYSHGPTVNPGDQGQLVADSQNLLHDFGPPGITYYRDLLASGMTLTVNPSLLNRFGFGSEGGFASVNSCDTDSSGNFIYVDDGRGNLVPRNCKHWYKAGIEIRTDRYPGPIMD